ncbi:AMP-binding protein [Brevibacillus agri]|uniref:class I adenylate-forming enzyme family protein n=1 Tax=Brevibacillus agri TaxID=51101 RepID=UPI002E1C17DE|nr:AMP-binding protein [Brevibacillus agri]MED1657212.1 AMP-binding protein [Brevibacillus agri]MED1689623.1 AMP-binding protein [Brevibacillus agri]MED1693909.1 AMP-binding protein [Brevibacillus agri]MED1698285.1 AMP-binding protein [Brevibacillus agri]
MDLGTLFQFAVERHPQYEALVQGDRRLTYEELNREVDRTASGLQALGIQRRDRVVLVLKNRMEMVILYWAIQKIGAVFTPINFRLTSDEIQYCVKDAQAKAVIYEPVSEKAVLEAVKGVDTLKIAVQGAEGADVSYEELLTKGSGHPKTEKMDDDDYCLMLYTSGTTGRPKGVPRTHQNEYSAAVAHIIQNQYSVQESTIGVMPLYHTMGMRSLLSIAFLNGKLVMTPDYDAELVLQHLEKESISCVYLVPTIFHDLVYHQNFSQYNLSALKKLGYAGAAMTKALTEDIIAKLQPEVFVNHYGSSEVYTFSICNYLDRKPGCAGKPGFHQRLRIVVPDPDGHSRPDDTVPPGVPGEIIVDLRSKEAFQGYWNRPDATSKAIREGWYFTGDMGVIDEEGDLYVLGRVDDMIISGGENIHPLEVEDVIAKHPKVAEVAVVGLPDSRWGEIVTAFVVPKDPLLTQEELDEYCKQSSFLSNFKRPRKYVLVDSIPKSPVGKILRRMLRDGDYQERLIKRESVS